MKRLTRRTILAAPTALAFGGTLLGARPARAAKQYGPGVTDSEIKIGNSSPRQSTAKTLDRPLHPLLGNSNHTSAGRTGFTTLFCRHEWCPRVYEAT